MRSLQSGQISEEDISKVKFQKCIVSSEIRVPDLPEYDPKWAYFLNLMYTKYAPEKLEKF